MDADTADSAEKTRKMGNLLHSEITGRILKAFFNVYHELGYGFLEKVGEYFADIIVENKVVVELKAVEAISERHEAQLINYLRATEMEVGLLLNFGKKPEYKRKVFSNHRK